jgi:hypothetical protein
VILAKIEIREFREFKEFRESRDIRLISDKPKIV